MKFPSVGAPPGVGRPGDAQAFVHKKLLGIVSKVSGFVPGPVGQIVSRVTRTLAGSRGTVPRTQTARPTLISAQEKEIGKQLKFSAPEVQSFSGGASGGGPCPAGFRQDFLSGQCEPGGGQAVGEAVMGIHGAGLVPGSRMIDRAVCLRGMQLGNDGVCYNKGQIRNNQRMWPAGRKPLLSGGDMRAIAIAARAGRRMEGATKRLQRLGMMKKPISRRAAPSKGKGTIIKEAGAGSVTVQ